MLGELIKVGAIYAFQWDDRHTFFGRVTHVTDGWVTLVTPGNTFFVQDIDVLWPVVAQEGAAG